MVTLAVVEPEIIPGLLKELKTLNDEAEKQGLRAFVWEADSVI